MCTFPLELVGLRPGVRVGIWPTQAIYPNEHLFLDYAQDEILRLDLRSSWEYASNPVAYLATRQKLLDVTLRVRKAGILPFEVATTLVSGRHHTLHVQIVDDHPIA